MYRKIKVTNDFRGQQYVTETTQRGNITTKRSFPIWRGQYSYFSYWDLDLLKREHAYQKDFPQLITGGALWFVKIGVH